MGQDFVLHVFGQCIELRLTFVAYLNVPLLHRQSMACDEYAVKYIFWIELRWVGFCNPTMAAAVSGNQILLRAERAGTGNGRVYAVHFTASNGQGGSCNGTVKVAVPHRKKDTAVEGPQLYNLFAP